MQPIPDDILKQFNALLDQKKIPLVVRDDYRKWLKYYLDFRIKYPPPDSKSEQVRLFMEKMRSKGKAGKDLHYAAYALSLFFQSQGRTKLAAAHTERVKEILPSPPVVSARPAASETDVAVVRRVSGRGGGRKYDERWCLERTKSPEWDAVIAMIYTHCVPSKTIKETKSPLDF